MKRELVVLLNNNIIGTVEQNKNGKLKFIYDDTWREADGAYPLSLSMPLAASEHPDKAINAFIWGLLPDNEFVLGKWAQKFQVSARNAFALISNVGEDCAGAVQFVLPDRLNQIQKENKGEIKWVSNTEIADRIRSLKSDHSAWRQPQDQGQFSLAGAQPKTALLLQGKKWGIPSGRIPTTHILKPPTGDFDGLAENEHYCLTLARKIGLPVSSSNVLRFDEEVVFVVERYDRQLSNREIIRVHQEDMCQALGVHPTVKYQNQGGPGITDLVKLLDDSSNSKQEDIETLIAATALNWAIGGTDAHAKNYSMLIGSGGKSRLAPLYDIASALPYDKLDYQKLKLAMKIGGKYRLRDIRMRQWEKLSADVKIDPEVIVEIVRNVLKKVEDSAGLVRSEIQKQGLDHPIVNRIDEMISNRASQLIKLL